MKQRTKVPRIFKIPYKHNWMAKRYTDSEKWKKDFIKTLPAEYKLFWLYLLDECDNAGIWNVELEIAELRLGIKLSMTKIRGFFKERIVEFDNGTKWFIPDFISFQYGELDVKNRAHKSVLEKLNKYAQKGLTRVSRDPMDKDKDKDKDIGGVGGFSEPNPKPEIPPPLAVVSSGQFVTVHNVAKPTLQQVHEFFVRAGSDIRSAEKFFNYYEGLGWMKGMSAIRNWTSFANTWIADNGRKADENKPSKMKTAQELLEERKRKEAENV